MKRLLLAAVAVLAFGLAACMPAPAPSDPIAECNAGVSDVQAHRPDIWIVQATCANYGDTGWSGNYDFPTPNVRINTFYGSDRRGFYDITAHEAGHGWYFLRLSLAQTDRADAIIGTDRIADPGGEMYAEAYAMLIYGKASTTLALDGNQANALCAERLVPC
jgi:hypothetical protein